MYYVVYIPLPGKSEPPGLCIPRDMAGIVFIARAIGDRDELVSIKALCVIGPFRNFSPIFGVSVAAHRPLFSFCFRLLLLLRGLFDFICRI